MAPRAARDTRAQAREPGRRDNRLANDVRVSPDEGAGAAPGRRCHTGHDQSKPTLDCSQRVLLRRFMEQQINVIPIKTAVAEHPTCIARTTSARCMHLGFSISKQTCRVNSEVLIMEPPEVYGKLPWEKPPTRGQTERPEDPPSGREPCHEKSKGTGSHKLAGTKDKTETFCDGDAHYWCNVPKRNDQPRERMPRPPCSVVFAVRCAIKSTAAYDVIRSFLPDRR